MNARIPAAKRLPRAARQAIAEYNDELQVETFRRWLKLVTVVLHTEFKFGHGRIANFLDKVAQVAENEEHDEIFWLHVDKVLIEELKLDFKPENYAEMER